MTKIFCVVAHPDYYPMGGTWDIQAAYDNEAAAKKHVEHLKHLKSLDDDEYDFDVIAVRELLIESEFAE